jgi:hypothetical protein
VINILLIILTLYYTNTRKNRRDRYFSIYSNHYEEVLRKYLFNEIDWDLTLVKLKRYKRPLNRRILISVLVNFQEILRGDVDNAMSDIYYRLGLYNDSIRLTRSSRFYKKILGFRELTNLYPKGAEEFIEQYINSPDDLVAAEAQASYILLHPENPFDFLKKLTGPFTRWTQLTAFYLLRKHPISVPSFAGYLQSENRNIKKFSLRMIIYFQQIECESEILKMLDNPDETVRFLCIQSINSLRLFSGKELLKNRYPSETLKNQTEIVKALRNIGENEDYDFLENIIKSGSITLQTEACRALYYLNPECLDRLKLTDPKSELKIKQFIAHVTDQRN